MKPWVQDVITLCRTQGPQTATDLTTFVAKRQLDASDSLMYGGRSLASNEIVSRLKVVRGVLVDCVGYAPHKGEDGSPRRRKLYMVTAGRSSNEEEASRENESRSKQTEGSDS